MPAAPSASCARAHAASGVSQSSAVPVTRDATWRAPSASSSSARPTLSPGASAASRQHRFSSSRTLPGQSCARRRSSAAGARRLAGAWNFAAAAARKRSASRGTSSRRSRSGGRRSRTTSSRCSRSARKRPSATSVSRSWWVAATTRTSTRISSRPPTRKNSPSASTRSNRVCNGSGMSPISSRNRVPPLACSKRPRWRRCAPVNAPASWPNSSLSSSSAGIAAVLSATNGLPARGDSRCSARATSSLPVPVSPVTSTDSGACASRPIARNSVCIAGVSPTSASASDGATGAASPAASALPALAPSVRAASATASSRSKGLDRNSCAPPRNAPAVLAMSV